MKLLNVQELARELRCSDETVYRGIRAGRIPVIRPGPRILLFDLHAVIQALTYPPARTLAPDGSALVDGTWPAVEAPENGAGEDP